MPRESIAMSREELLAFLKDERCLALGTLDESGRVWPDAAACLLQGETLYFRIPRRSRSHANIRRDARVCCSLDRFPSYYEIKGATLHGMAREVSDRAVRPALDGLPDPVTGRDDADGAFYAIGLDDVASFDFAKIKRRVTER